MLILLLAAVGCGSSKPNPDGAGGTSGGSQSFMPLAIGNHWTYQIKDPDGTISSKVRTVVAEEPVGGVGPHAAAMAFRLVSGNKIADPEGDRSWQAWVDADGGKRLVRYREQSVDNKDGFVKNETYWDPPRLYLDDTTTRVAAGGNWREPEYTEYKIDIDRVDPDGGVGLDGGDSVIPDGGMKMTTAIQDVWMVISAKQSITVPAGTFDALALRRVGNQGSSIKNFWYARGIGKLRETEEGQPTEELSSYLVQ